MKFKVKRLAAGAYKLMDGGGADAKPLALVFRAWQNARTGRFWTWEAKIFGADAADVIAHNEGFGRKRDAVAWAKRWARDPALMRAQYAKFWERHSAAPHNETIHIPPEFRRKGTRDTLAATQAKGGLDVHK